MKKLRTMMKDELPSLLQLSQRYEGLLTKSRHMKNILKESLHTFTIKGMREVYVTAAKSKV